MSRYEIAQVVLSVASLVALIWYAWLTRRLVSQGQEQIARSEQALVLIQRNVSPGDLYVLANVLPGIAINVVYRETRPAAAPLPWRIAWPIAGRAVSSPPQRLLQRLTESANSDMTNRPYFTILTQNAAGRWSKAEQVIESGGAVSCRLVTVTAEDVEGASMTAHASRFDV